MDSRMFLCHAIETPIEDSRSGDAIFHTLRCFCCSELAYFWGLVLAMGMDTSVMKRITGSCSIRI